MIVCFSIIQLLHQYEINMYNNIVHIQHIYFHLITHSPPPRSSVNRLNYLFRDGSIVPVVGQVNFRNQAVVVWNVSQEDDTERNCSIRHDARTEQEKNYLLETSPLPQKSCAVIIVCHCLQIQTVHFSFCPREMPRETDIFLLDAVKVWEGLLFQLCTLGP